MSQDAQNPWFKRKLKGIITPSTEKKETPDGFWYKTPSGDVIEKTQLKENFYVTPKEGYHVRIGSEEYFEMIRRKTGVYSGRGPCQLGALIAGAPQDIFEKVGDFGEALGIGFQIKDDLLNLEEEAGESKEYGKERGGDIREGKRSLSTIHLLEKLGHPDAEKLKKILHLQ